MKERLRSCGFRVTLGVVVLVTVAAACDPPEEVCEDELRAGDSDAPAVLDPEHEIPGALKDDDLPPIVDLKTDEPISPGIIKSPEKAVLLGKALFWDMQAGSDGQACASCHFSAGADPRARNQLSPGLLGGNALFDPTRSGGGGGPNYTLVAGDFPFHVKQDPTDRDSKVLFDTDDVASSQGVTSAQFKAVTPGALADTCEVIPDPLFNLDDINLRRVEPRNTPTTINAAFNFRSFWDGRANRLFNGVDPFGRRNEDAFVLEVKKGKVVKRELLLSNSSLASQAVGPTLNDFEMSCAGRLFADVGKKLLSAPTVPLAFQAVHPQDSVLGPLANTVTGTGLNTTYEQLIKEAFADKFWDSSDLFDADKKLLKKPEQVPESQRFTLMEANFSLFWGLAIQAYERTLIANNTPFDKFREGDPGALDDAALAGLDVFMDRGKCVNCHDTAMFTKASTLHLIPEDEEGGLVERMLMSEEHLHYAVKTDHPVTIFPEKKYKGWKWGYDLSLDVEGTPTLSGSKIIPGAAVGSIELTRNASGSKCIYAPKTLTLGEDKGIPRDAWIEAERLQGVGCPPHLRVVVVDDVGLGGKGWFDHVGIDNGYGGFLHTALVSADEVELREPALYDNGFYNIGVRPTAEDLGVGAKDPFGNPLSFTEQFVRMLLGKDVPDPFEVDPCSFEVPWIVKLDGVLFPGGFTDKSTCGGLLSFVTGVPRDNKKNERFIKNLRTAVRGAFKTPTLRNIQLTAPYMHNGGMATLEQVIDFYDRGGDFHRNRELDPDITRLELTDEEKSNLAHFLRALTDPDVVYERAPFDHPQLFVPRGLQMVEDMNPADGRADEDLFTDGLMIPAVGKDGRDDPIPTFLGLEDDKLP